MTAQSAEARAIPIDAAGIYSEPCREAAIEAEPPCTETDPRRALAVLSATILASAMAFIDATVVNVALPIIQADLKASTASLQWVVESYALFLAALLIPGGAMGDHFGRRRIFLLGVLIFAVASLACALAPNAPALIVARAVQGVGAAFLVPGSLALIGANFPAEERGRAIGTWSAASALTMAVGPVLGGWLAETQGWQAIFLLNLPLAVGVIAIALWGIPESRDEEDPGPLDWPGAALVTCALTGIVLALIEAPRLGFTHPAVVLSFFMGIAAAFGFVHRIRHAARPMVPPKLFENATFTGANLLTFAVYAGLGGALFFLPLRLIEVNGFSATAAAASFLPFVAIMALFSRYAGSLADRLGPRPLLVAGPLITAVGYGLLILPGAAPQSFWTSVLPGILALGAGMTLTVAPLTSTVMGAVPERLTGTASGVNNAVSRTAGLLAIAGFGLVFVAVSDASLARALASMPEEARSLGHVFGRVWIPESLESEWGDAIRTAGKEAFVDGYRAALGVAAGLTLVGAAIAARFIGTR